MEIREKNASCRWSYPDANGARLILTISADANGRAWIFSDAEMRRPVGDTLTT
jgi:hypothetical protein